MSGELVCELVGGYFDGRTVNLPPGRDGLPLDVVYLPVPPGSPRWDLAADGPPASAAVDRASYVRDRISDRTHRWVYRARGQERPFWPEARFV